MKLLAIDTSTEVASLALMVNEELLSSEQDSQKTHAQLLLPMIDRLMADAALARNQLDGIIFGCGPGSFTGLRIACSIAKGLAYAHDVPLIPVGSLDTIAWLAREQTKASDSAVLAVLDARMQEMYWSYYAPGCYITEAQLNSVSDIQLPADERGVLLLAGIGKELYWPNFPDPIKAQIKADLTLFPKASAMIRLAQHANLPSISAAMAQPLYVRNQVTQGGSRSG